MPNLGFNSSISMKDIIMIFNDFYNIYLNGLDFNYVINAYIKKNLKLIFGKDFSFEIIKYNTDKLIGSNIINREIKFNEHLFGYILILCDEKITKYTDIYNSSEFNLFITYISFFHHNYYHIKKIDLINCNLFTDVLNMMNDGVIITDNELNILFANRTSNVILNKIHGDNNFIGTHIHNIFSQLDEYVEGNTIYKNRKINYKINKHNTDFTMMLTVNTLLHNNIYYNIIIIIPTEFTKIKCDNVGFMSHELRNPLQTISFASELIKINKNDKYLEIIDKSVSDMIKIINDILDVDRINSNQIHLNISCVKISDILNDIEFSIPKNDSIVFQIKND